MLLEQVPVVPSTWQRLDWDRITTLAVFKPWPPPPELVCHAHNKGARVVSADATQWMHTALRSNASHRTVWVNNHVKQMMASGTDGVNVDLEAYRGGLPGSKTPVPNAAAPLFTSLLAQLRYALRKKNPQAQLSMASQIWPTAYPTYFYGGYNYTAIAKEVDFFVVMGYDMTQDVRLARRGTMASDPAGTWDEHANAPLPGLIDGVEQYRHLGVDPSQLVMALPWYGYMFTCANNTRGSYCSIVGNQVHGCPRSECPQIGFGQILGLRSETNRSAIGAVRRDNTTASVYFDWFNGSGVRHQCWYDNAETLSDKFAWASKARLRGVGCFLSTMLLCEAQTASTCERVLRNPEMNASSVAMWSAFDHFRRV